MLLIVMVALAGGYAIATVYFRLSTPAFVVVTSYQIELWNEAKTETVAIFDFGTVMPGSSWTTEAIHVKNVGDSELWWAALVEGLPEGFQLLCEHAYDGETPDWLFIPLGTIYGWKTNPNDGGLMPGEFTTHMLRFTLVNEDAPFGEYGFTICFDAMDSSTG